MDKQFNQWLAKRIINEISGWQKKTGNSILHIPAKITVNILYAWYVGLITKQRAFEWLDAMIDFYKQEKMCK
jgi:hypothetical protein